jgi:uncharacterized protein YhaN
MKIRAWHIEGFGVYSDARLPEPGLGEGLTLLIGANESGKSTLLDFLRYTLFGYPDKRSSFPQREPLRGGIHGGTLFYEADGIDYRLSRRSGRQTAAFQLRDQQGETYAESELYRQLGHLSPAVFRSLFGFSLRELEDIHSLTEGEVQNLVFAASLGPSVQKVCELQARIEEQAESIFRGQARASAQNPPRLLQLGKVLQGLKEKLDHAQRESLEVAVLCRERQTRHQRLGELEDQIQQAQFEIQKLDRLIQGRDPWVKRCQALRERSALGEMRPFPVDGENTWLRLQDILSVRQRNLVECARELKAGEEQLRQMPAEFPRLALAGEAESLAMDLERYKEAVKQAQNNDRKAQDLMIVWQRLSAELGAGWPAEVVCEFDPSLLAQDQASVRIEGIRAAQESLRRKQDEASRLEEVCSELARKCSVKVEKRESMEQAAPIASADDLTRQEARLIELREIREVHSDHVNELREADHHLEQIRLFLDRNGTAPLTHPRWLGIGVCTLGLIWFAAAGLLLFYHENLGAALCGGFGVLLILLAVLLRRNAARTAPVSKVPAQLQQAQETRDAAERKLRECESRGKAKADEAQYSWPISASDLAQGEHQIQENRDRLAQRTNLDAEIQELRTEENAQHQSLKQSQVERAQAQHHLEASLRDWQQFLAERRLPMDVTPDTALLIFAKVKEASQTLRDAGNLAAEAEQSRRAASDFLVRLTDFMRRAQWSATGEPAECFARFSDLRKQMDQERTEKAARVSREEHLSLIRRKYQQAEQDVTSAQADCQNYLNQAGVNSAEELQELLGRVRRSGELEQTVRERDMELAVIFGQAGAPEDLRDAWKSQTWPDWIAQKTVGEDKKKQLIVERDQLIRELQTLDDAIDRQFNSDELAALQLQVATQEEELRKGVSDWLRLAITGELLRRTREQFELQNPALDEASRLFQIVTGGRYQRIFVPLDSSDVAILPAKGQALSVDALSRGTLEQLYLCLRLGYVTYYQKKQDLRLPLLMDDVAVNFDAERMIQVLRVLGELCHAGQQILFFTCHEPSKENLPAQTRIFRIRDFQFERLDQH